MVDHALAKDRAAQLHAGFNLALFAPASVTSRAPAVAACTALASSTTMCDGAVAVDRAPGRCHGRQCQCVGGGPRADQDGLQAIMLEYAAAFLFDLRIERIFAVGMLAFDR